MQESETLPAVSGGVEPESISVIVRFILDGKTLYAHLRSDLTADSARYLPEGATDIKVLSGDDLVEYETSLAKEGRKSEIDARLIAIEGYSLRPVSAITAATLRGEQSDPEDEIILDALEREKEALRAERRALA